MYPHRIHLHGPWQHLGTPDKVIVPRSQFARLDSTRPVQLCRPFRWPNPLLPFERLWLVASCNRPLQVLLNEQPIGNHVDPWTPFEHDITPLVQATNQLELTLEPTGPTLLGPVYLEVRRDVHLRALTGETLWHEEGPRLQLRGQVIGKTSRPLSLVVRLDDLEVLYTELPLASVFEVVTPPLQVRRWQPHQANVMHHLDCQLLDPACVLSQHSFATGFRQVDPVAADEYRVNGKPCSVTPSQWDEPLDDSATLATADRTGQLLILTNARAETTSAAPFLWHHPCILNVIR